MNYVIKNRSGGFHPSSLELGGYILPELFVTLSMVEG